MVVGMKFEVSLPNPHRMESNLCAPALNQAQGESPIIY